MISARVLIRPKDGILDAQGKAVESALPALGFDGIEHVRVGRIVELNAESADRLDALLTAAGFETVGGTSLFRLAAHPRAQAVADMLGHAGVHIRRFAAAPHWLRFGIPAERDWPRLEAALRSTR